MKTKRFSKVLALMVAAVMIFSALPLMAFAADEAATYTVSFGAPAIPMNVDTKVDLKTLDIEMVKGETAVSGADITWAAEAQEGLTLDADKKTVKVTAAGNYKLTATANGVTKNVWVIAKTAEQDKFYLVNVNVRDTITSGSWHLTNNHNDGTEYDAATLAVSRQHLIPGRTEEGSVDFIQIQTTLPGSGGALVYVDEIFEDFADYTVETFSAVKPGNGQNGAGVVGRAVLDETGKKYTKGTFSHIRATEQVAIAKVAEGDDRFGGAGDARTSSNFKLWSGGVEEFYTVKSVFDGSDVYFYINDDAANTLGDGEGDQLLDSSRYASVAQIHTDGAGYPGVMGYGQPTRFADFAVYLNSNDMPATMTDEPDAPTPDPDPTPEVSYTVSFSAPAIPMNVYTKLDLRTIAVEMVKGEAAVSGSDITWAAAAQEGLTFDATNKTVEVAKVGNYKLTATANGVTKNVWVVVKTEEQDKFYLVNMPELNSETFVVEDWRLVGGKNDTDLTVQDVIDQGNINLVNNFIVVRQGIGSSKVGGALIYVNEIFKDFADYTVETYSSNSANPAAQTLTNVGNGAVGRITLNENETGWVTGVMSYVRNNEQISISRTAVPKVDFGGFSPAAEFNGAWKIWNGSEANHHTVKTVFDGSKVLFYLNETLLLDSTTEPKYEAQIATHHDGAGYPGMLAYGAHGRFEQFYVYLNSTEMPAAEKVTPPAPTPDPDPTPTPDPDPTPDQDPTPGTKPSKPNSPQTGDNTNLALWAALLFVSGLGIFGTVLFGRNKREEN